MRLASALYSDFYPFDGLSHSDKAVVVEPDQLTKKDVLIVWGGADISPSLYNKRVSRFCHATDKPSQRDTMEWELMQKAIDLKIPIIGVCRGAQMLCAAAGGFLYQHVGNHGQAHNMFIKDAEPVLINSIHHQMMAIKDTKHELIGWADEVSMGFDEDKIVKLETNPEFVYFTDIKGIAVQWHPEMMSEKSPATRYLMNKLEKELL